MSRAIIFANGRIENLERARGLLREKDVLIAADGGTRHVLRLGRMPAVLVGDLDSLSPRELERAKTGGCKIVQHPRDKDETDFELALRYAVEAGYSHILVIGALGGRLDQTLGNLSLLSGTECASLDIALDDGTERAWFVRQATEIQGQAGDLISLLPWGGEVQGITTSGLRWPLKDETLFSEKTRGISNELMGERGSVSMRSGLLLVIQRRT